MLQMALVAETDSAPIVAALIALGAAILGSLIAVGWPTWRSRQIRRRFVKLIRRELEEIGPHISPGWADVIGQTLWVAAPAERPWWEYLTKRFVHEEFLSRDRIGDHRDFALSLRPTLVYQLSQLWIAHAKRDGEQWKFYLRQLAENKEVAGDRLTRAARLWEHIVDTSPASKAESIRSANLIGSPAVERIDGLFRARLDAYDKLMPMLTGNAMANEAQREALVAPANGPLREWIRTHGLLMSGDALYRFLRLLALLEGELNDVAPADSDEILRTARSDLRTELKIDLGVRHPDERDQPTDRNRRPDG